MAIRTGTVRRVWFAIRTAVGIFLAIVGEIFVIKRVSPFHTSPTWSSPWYTCGGLDFKIEIDFKNENTVHGNRLLLFY